MVNPGWSNYLFLLGTLFSSETEGGSLLNPSPQSRNMPTCCQGDKILSCLQVALDSSILGDDDLYLEPLNATLSFVGMVDGTINGYHYGNDDVDFSLTFNARTGGVYGHASLDDGRSFTIEYCGGDVHVLKELDVKNMQTANMVELPKEVNEKNASSVDISRNRIYFDTTTVVTYSVKFYYTPQVAASTADIQSFIDQVIQITNQGYINSKVPLRVKTHCKEQAILNDIGDSSVMLDKFKRMKGSCSALRGTADAAVLLVGSFTDGVGGIAYLNGISNGCTISVVQKDYALGTNVVGHELGHNIGLYHNREVLNSNNPHFSYGYGHLIDEGYVTIMSYQDFKHLNFANYYSNPDVKFPKTGTPTGIAGVSDNARVLTEQRFKMINIGDESRAC